MRTDHRYHLFCNFTALLFAVLLCLQSAFITYCAQSPVRCCKTFVAYYRNQTQTCQIRVGAWTITIYTGRTQIDNVAEQKQIYTDYISVEWFPGNDAFHTCNHTLMCHCMRSRLVYILGFVKIRRQITMTACVSILPWKSVREGIWNISSLLLLTLPKEGVIKQLMIN